MHWDNRCRAWKADRDALRRLGDAILDNEIPIPFDSTLGTCLRVLVGCDAGNGEFTTIEIKGNSACLTLLGEPQYIEET